MCCIAHILCVNHTMRGATLDYRKAYEKLSKAVWKFEQTYNDAYVKLMLAMRDIDNEAGETDPPLVLAETPEGRMFED